MLPRVSILLGAAAAARAAGHDNNVAGARIDATSFVCADDCAHDGFFLSALGSYCPLSQVVVDKVPNKATQLLCQERESESSHGNLQPLAGSGETAPACRVQKHDGKTVADCVASRRFAAKGAKIVEWPEIRVEFQGKSTGRMRRSDPDASDVDPTDPSQPGQPGQPGIPGPPGIPGQPSEPEPPSEPSPPGGGECNGGPGVPSDPSDPSGPGGGLGGPGGGPPGGGPPGGGPPGRGPPGRGPPGRGGVGGLPDNPTPEDILEGIRLGRIELEGAGERRVSGSVFRRWRGRFTRD